MYASSYTGGRNVGLNRVLPMFFVSLLFAVVGTFVGTMVPSALYMPLVVVEFIMIFAAAFLRKRRVGFLFVYLFTFLSGVTFYPVLNYYLHNIGGNMVMAAFVVTTLSYGAAAVYAMVSKANFSYLGGFLGIGLIALILMGIWNLIWPLGGTAYLLYTLLAVFIFIGYTLFDISRIARYGVPAEMVPMVVLNLYLDFFNLLLAILRLFGINLGINNRNN